MRETMAGQATAMSALLDDDRAIEPVAARLVGRRVLLAGTGTSWHAAEQGAHFLARAGLDVTASQSGDVALGGFPLERYGALIALTHTGAKRYTAAAVDAAREHGLEVVQISGLGVEGADLHTVARERSAAYTASHLGALLRLAQLATVLGADLGPLNDVPSAVQAQVDLERNPLPVPERLLELVGGGINQWTAAEGALKIRETAYVASEGLSVEQFLHGPSVALRATDRLVCLDGGGSWSERIAEVASAASASGVTVTTIEAAELGELLSIFPLTAAVQRIALEAAEELGVNPDSFGRDVPGREAWASIPL
jgi:glucosamine--fructose-6-phosphate aminotransferase (isomerizing)